MYLHSGIAPEVLLLCGFGPRVVAAHREEAGQPRGGPRVGQGGGGGRGRAEVGVGGGPGVPVPAVAQRLRHDVPDQDGSQRIRAWN